MMFNRNAIIRRLLAHSRRARAMLSLSMVALVAYRSEFLGERKIFSPNKGRCGEYDPNTTNLMERRRLCGETHWSYGDWYPGGAGTWWPSEISYSENAENPVPGGEGNIGYVLTITECPDASESEIFETAVVVENSVCNCTKDSEVYDYTMYAIVHVDSIKCLDSRGLQYDLVKLLSDAGYWVKIFHEPVKQEEITGSQYLRDNIESDVGIKDLTKLTAFTLDTHPLVVMIDTETLVMQPLDAEFDALLSDAAADVISTRDANFAIATNMLILKPNNDTFIALKDAFATSSYDLSTGWGSTGVGNFPGGMGTSGLLTYYYNLHNSAAYDVDKCLYNNGNELECQSMTLSQIKVAKIPKAQCGDPYDCTYDPNWEGLCEDYRREWYRKRADLEDTRWTGNKTKSARLGQYEPDVFLGYCEHEGKAGFDLLLQAIAPTPPPTGIPTQAPTKAPVPTVSPTPPLPTMTPTQFPTRDCGDVYQQCLFPQEFSKVSCKCDCPYPRETCDTEGPTPYFNEGSCSCTPVPAWEIVCLDNFSCPPGTYVTQDCSCTEDPCAACPLHARCQLEPVLMCIDCECGFCDFDMGHCCDFNGVNNCKSATNKNECLLQNDFMAAFEGTGSVCSGLEISLKAVPNGCGCQPSEEEPCTYDPDLKTEDEKCFVCTAKEILPDATLCADCRQCLLPCDPCVGAAATTSDMETCLGSKSFDSTCRLNCLDACKKSFIEDL